MFNREENVFIKTLLEDELGRIVTKKCSIYDYNELKEYKEFIKEREYYIRTLLSKYR